MSRHWDSLQACRRKVRYATYDRARRVFSTGAMLHVGIRIYGCMTCSGWHLGNWREWYRLRTAELYRELKEGQSDIWPVMEYYRNRSLATKAIEYPVNPA